MRPYRTLATLAILISALAACGGNDGAQPGNMTIRLAPSSVQATGGATIETTLLILNAPEQSLEAQVRVDAEAGTVGDVTVSPSSVRLDATTVLQPLEIVLPNDASTDTPLRLNVEVQAGESVARAPLLVTLEPSDAPTLHVTLADASVTTTPGVTWEGTRLLTPTAGFGGVIAWSLEDEDGTPWPHATLSPTETTVGADDPILERWSITVSDDAPTGEAALSLVGRSNGLMIRSNLDVLVVAVAPPALSMSIDPFAVSATPSGTADATLLLQSLHGLEGPVALTVVSATGESIPGMTLSPTSIALASNDSILVPIAFEASNAAVEGTYLARVRASAGDASASSLVTIDVGTPQFSVSIAPDLVYTRPGDPVGTALTLNPANGFSGTVTLSLTDASNQPVSAIPLSPTTVNMTGPNAQTIPILLSPSDAITPTDATYDLRIHAMGDGWTDEADFRLFLQSRPLVGFDEPIVYEPFSQDHFPHALAIGDVDRNGTLDLVVVANYGEGAGTGELLIGLGDGSGAFQWNGLTQPLAIGDDPRDVVITNLDDDAAVDVVVSSWLANTVTNYGNFDAVAGAFQGPSSTVSLSDDTTYWGRPTDMAIRDHDGDGDPDVYVIRRDSDFNDVAVIAMTPSGLSLTDTAYAAFEPASGSAYLNALTLANLVGSDDIVVATALGGEGSVVSSWTRTTQGVDASRTDVFVSDSNVSLTDVTAMVTGDVDRNGATDVVLASCYDEGVSRHAVISLLNDGSFTQPTLVESIIDGHCPTAIAIGDVNRDGILDVVTGNDDSNDTISVMIGDGAGGFQSAAAYSPFDSGGNYVSDVHLADVNRDGKLDVIAANYDGGTGSVSILLAR